MTNSVVTLALSLILLAVSATWTGPIRILTPRYYTNVECVYYDPASDVTHVAVHEEYVQTVRHLAVSSNGTVLYSTLFSGTCHRGPKIVIRGAGDGKRLFMALSYTFSGSNSWVGFTESGDGGKTWAEPKDIVANVETMGAKYLQDLLYIAETGRVYVFFTGYSEHSLMVISRAAHSLIFSGVKTIAKNFAPQYTRHARASYESWVGKLLLHVVYVDNSKWQLKHIRSHDMGVTWQPAKGIANASDVYHITGMVSHPVLSSGIYLSYNKFVNSGPEILTRSLDHGITYEHQRSLTEGYSFLEGDSSALLLCGNKDPVLASLIVTTDKKGLNTTVEYTLWTQQQELKPYHRVYPKTSRPLSAGADCAVNANGGLNMFTAVSVEEKNGAIKHYAVYFAKETGKFPE